ncbi:MAG: cob(I)yrinic acid a,c-diamide adenosyltransferase [Deltaproteobacteria bacterium]|nr:cob(I)yrinic acid a,c-diamide adenosyltransferase [Deltaproteobacteria bacterium]
MKKKGLIHIYTGDGKGKTSAALGLAMRAAGSGRKVFFVQFFKEDAAPSGEKAFLGGVKSTIEMLRSNCRHPIFTRSKTDLQKVQSSVSVTFAEVKKRVKEGMVDLLVLDEVMAAVNGGWLSVKELLDFLETRPAHIEVVLTGRSAPMELVKTADYVTEMLKIKHPFDNGVGARQGIEY